MGAIRIPNATISFPQEILSAHFAMILLIWIPMVYLPKYFAFMINQLNLDTIKTSYNLEFIHHFLPLASK
jgi:hypothetical protein